MNAALSLTAVALLIIITLVIGFAGLRFSRTTSDIFVASRSVRPLGNASAISGEYLSAGTFLGLAGLVLLAGAEGFWFPIGYAAGYLLVLLFVGAPLRRSGAYTIPDFVEARVRSRTARHVTSLVVVVIGWMYIVPQLHGAAITLNVVANVPLWVGSVVVAVVVGLAVAAGGMRAITVVQAFQYWLKLTALLVPVILLLFALGERQESFDPQLVFPVAQGPASGHLYSTVSLLIALLLGTIGLPHVLVRFYTSPDGGSARRATVLVIVLISVFYAVSSTLGLIARVAAPDLAVAGLADTVALALPGRLLPQPWADLVTALVVAGAFAAFLATSSGLVVSLAGVVSQDLFGGTVRSFRFSALLCAAMPLLFSFLTIADGLVSSVGVVFLFAASSLTPVIVLGVWWRGLTARGAIAGMCVGAIGCTVSLVASAAVDAGEGWRVLLTQPGAWLIPCSTLVVIVVSLLDRARIPGRVDRFLARLHTPEEA